MGVQSTRTLSPHPGASCTSRISLTEHGSYRRLVLPGGGLQRQLQWTQHRSSYLPLTLCPRAGIWACVSGATYTQPVTVWVAQKDAVLQTPGICALTANDHRGAGLKKHLPALGHAPPPPGGSDFQGIQMASTPLLHLSLFPLLKAR